MLLEALERSVLVVRARDVRADRLELVDLLLPVRLTQRKPFASAAALFKIRRRRNATHKLLLGGLLGLLEVARLALVELVRVHLRPGVANNVRAGREVTLPEKREEGGEGLVEER